MRLFGYRKLGGLIGGDPTRRALGHIMIASRFGSSIEGILRFSPWNSSDGMALHSAFRTQIFGMLCSKTHPCLGFPWSGLTGRLGGSPYNYLNLNPQGK